MIVSDNIDEVDVSTDSGVGDATKNISGFSIFYLFLYKRFCIYMFYHVLSTLFVKKACAKISRRLNNFFF